MLVEPFAHMVASDSEVDVRIVPDEETLAAFGPVLGDRAAWEPCYRAGARQASDVADRLRTGML